MHKHALRAAVTATGLVTAFAAGTAGARADQDPKGLATPGLTVPASFQSIGPSGGPLTRIHLSDRLACQVSYSGYPTGQMYGPSSGPADCGTFLAVGERLYGPAFTTHGGSATPFASASWYTPFTPVSQTAQTGSGTITDPYIVTTVADAGVTGLRVTRIDTYVNGRGNYRSDVVLTNTSGLPQQARLYHGFDCYLSGNDRGVGVAASSPSSATSWAGCAGNNRIERLISLTAGNGHYENSYSSVWARINSRTALPNTVNNNVHDNAVAIDWAVSLPHNGSVIRSFLTDFVNSPVTVSPPELPSSWLDAAVVVDTGETAPRGTVQVVVGSGENQFAVRIPIGTASSSS